MLECLVVAGLRWGSSCQNIAMADRANRSLTSRPAQQPSPARLERMGRNQVREKGGGGGRLDTRNEITT